MWLSSEVNSTLELFRGTNDGGETELMLDRAGNIRARWPSNIPRGPAPTETLIVDAERIAQTAEAPASHAGHAR